MTNTVSDTTLTTKKEILASPLMVSEPAYEAELEQVDSSKVIDGRSQFNSAGLVNPAKSIGCVSVEALEYLQSSIVSFDSNDLFDAQSLIEKKLSVTDQQLQAVKEYDDSHFSLLCIEEKENVIVMTSKDINDGDFYGCVGNEFFKNS